MTTDGLAPDATSWDPLPAPREAPASSDVRAWRRDVIDGVTRRFAFAAVPALLLGLIARLVRGDWDLVAILIPTLLAALGTLSPRLSPRARVALVVVLLLWANGFLMVYARQIPFHGVLMPMAATFATMMGGARWGWWTLGIASATWIAPWISAMFGVWSPVEIGWPSQYLRLWFLHSMLSGGLVASVEHVTHHLEAAVAQSDALLGRVREAEEEERSRLARELHDDFGQRLTALQMKLQLSRIDPARHPTAIDDGVAIATDLLKDVRTFARGLRPPLLDEVGLGPALRALVEAHVDRGAVAVTLDVPDTLPRLPASQELAAYRVVQEALANALRHASPTRVALGVRAEAGAVIVALTDDGRGFDPAHAADVSPREHLGLVSMRERAAFIGATLDVRSAPGRGTAVRLKIPFAPAKAAGASASVGTSWPQRS